MLERDSLGRELVDLGAREYQVRIGPFPQGARVAAPGSRALVGVFGQKPEGYLFVPISDMVAGIDLSHHQGTVNWKRVSGAGVRFAYVKATEGATWQDGQFPANWAQAKANNVHRGAYHLLKRPRSSNAATQARNFLNYVALQAGDMPPALDVETSDLAGIIQDVGVAAAWQHIWEWCAIVESAVGYRPLLYMSKRGIDALRGNVGNLPALELWLPRYRRVNRLPPLPANNRGDLIWPHWSFWQHSETGTIAGIKGRSDLNLFNGDAQGFTRWIDDNQP